MWIQEMQGLHIHLSCVSWWEVLCPLKQQPFKISVYPIFVFLYLQALTDASTF